MSLGAKIATTGKSAATTGGALSMLAGICAVLVILIFVVFGQTVGHGFVNYDDSEYVYENPIVSKGLSFEGIRWAFTHVHSYNWHPLTTLSHMLDCQVYGLWAGGHHLTNVLLHAAVAVLLFLLLREMTGALWRSAFVAAVFAIHPLRVESVAWIAERKDVLSGVFFMLTLWAYARYARRPESRGRYALVAVWFALGLMSKPMLVTLPLLLLLLDYWPLGRLQQKSQLPRLLREKLPLFALSALSCVATVIAQGKAIQPLERFSLAVRIGNALVAYGVYLGKMVCPTRLAVLYPMLKSGCPPWQVIAALLLLTALTAGAWVLRRRQPFLLVGWWWYLGMLVPVIGILQVGLQAYADRYTYLPQIGLYLAVTWAAVDWAGKWRHRRLALGGLAVTALGSLLVVAHQQTTHWRDTQSLWTHTLANTRGNPFARYNFGTFLLHQGKEEEATAQFRESLRLNPLYDLAHLNLGFVLVQQGRIEEAMVKFNDALQVNPSCADAHYNLARVLLKQGRADEAIAQFRATLKINPADAEAHNSLGSTLFQQGRAEEAIARFRSALQINPGYAAAHQNLGNALLQQGRIDEAIVQFRETLRIDPANADVRTNLGYCLLRQGRAEEAIVQCREALRLNPAHALANNNLGDLLLRQGKTEEAIARFQAALQTDPALPGTRFNLGNALLQQGRLEEAVAQFREALRINPANPGALYNLGNTLFQLGRAEEAIPQMQKALELQPASGSIQNDLSWMLAAAPTASLRDGTRAVQLATQANQSSGGGNPLILETLAAAYAEAGDFAKAVQIAKKAMQLAETQSNTTLAAALRRELKLYEAGQSFREGP